MLEVFDAARHSRHIGHARTAYPFIVQTKSSDMGPESMQCRKECESERAGCEKDRMCGGYGKREFFDVCNSFAGAADRRREKGYPWKRMDLYRDR